MKIEWDPIKAKSNLRKHKVSFEEASTALSDPMAATGADPDHSITEDRYVTFGVSKRGRLLVVAHTEEGEIIRIISARMASKGERELYEEG
ncbi:MAG: BrnT family toxin [Pseudomonadota bacterium]